MKKVAVLALLVICSFAFIRVSDLIDFEPVPIPPSAQRLGGDVKRVMIILLPAIM